MIKLRIADIDWRTVDDEVLLLDRRSWRYLALNASGSFLWPKLVEGATREELCSAVVAHYDVTPDRAGSDVDAFLNWLAAEDLLAP